MKTHYYRDEICNIDRKILGKDAYAFSVLSRILGSKCKLTITNHEDFIICHSAFPYPVWVWVSDKADENRKCEIYKIIKSNFEFSSYRFNTKYSLAEFLINRAKDEGIALCTSMNMRVYTFDNPTAPEDKRDIKAEIASEEDITPTARLIFDFRTETNMDILPMEECLNEAKRLIESRRLIICKERLRDSLELVCMCSYVIQGNLGLISHVYTKSAHRRRGFATAAVSLAVSRIKALGLMPILYTDADYIASNACYEAIGFELADKLCTLAKI